MALPLPETLSPSKVSNFKDCALAFRFVNIDKLPQPPSAAALKGTLVHRCLELLFSQEVQNDRTLAAAKDHFERAFTEIQTDTDFLRLKLGYDELEKWRDDSWKLVGKYFDVEDPTLVDCVSTELHLEARLNGARVRGIIDRLDRDANGDLVVVDYKTGRAPSEKYEQNKLGGVHFYSMLCERVLGIRPAKVQLMYLAVPLTITASATEQSVGGLEKRLSAAWKAIDQACAKEDFRPRPSRLCQWCGFQEYCPAVGGDLSRLPFRSN